MLRKLIVVDIFTKEEAISKQIFIVALVLPSMMISFTIIGIPFWYFYY